MTEAQTAERRKWLALGLLASAQFVVVLDASITNVALPSIGRALNFSQDHLSWVVNSYVLTFGGFLLLGGRAADLLGRRRARRRPRRRHRLSDPAHRRAPGSGPRRGNPLPRRALDRHHDVQGRARA